MPTGKSSVPSGSGERGRGGGAITIGIITRPQEKQVFRGEMQRGAKRRESSAYDPRVVGQACREEEKQAHQHERATNNKEKKKNTTVSRCRFQDAAFQNISRAQTTHPRLVPRQSTESSILCDSLKSCSGGMPSLRHSKRELATHGRESSAESKGRVLWKRRRGLKRRGRTDKEGVQTSLTAVGG